MGCGFTVGAAFFFFFFLHFSQTSPLNYAPPTPIPRRPSRTARGRAGKWDRERRLKKNERNGSDDGLETYRKEGGRKENKQRGEIEKRNQEK